MFSWCGGDQDGESQDEDGGDEWEKHRMMEELLCEEVVIRLWIEWRIGVGMAVDVAVAVEQESRMEYSWFYIPVDLIVEDLKSDGDMVVNVDWVLTEKWLWGDREEQ